MEAIELKRLDGTRTSIGREALDRLAGELDGDVALPGEDSYAETKRIWNGMIEKRPARVVRALGVGDVVRTVDLARETGAELSIRSGGHNIAGLALSDGGLTLDVSRQRRVAVDAERRLARVAAGCTLGDVDRAT